MKGDDKKDGQSCPAKHCIRLWCPETFFFLPDAKNSRSVDGTTQHIIQGVCFLQEVRYSEFYISYLCGVLCPKKPTSTFVGDRSFPSKPE